METRIYGRLPCCVCGGRSRRGIFSFALSLRRDLCRTIFPRARDHFGADFFRPRGQHVAVVVAFIVAAAAFVVVVVIVAAVVSPLRCP